MHVNSEARNRTCGAAGDGEKGFSLLELVVAMVIFMIVTGAIWGLLRVAQQSRTVTNQKVQLTKAMRLGLNLVGRDTLNAGFGYPLASKSKVLVRNGSMSSLLEIPPAGPQSEVPPILPGNNVRPNTFNPNPGVMTDQITFLFKDTDFNPIPPLAPPEQTVSQPLSIGAAETVGGIDELVPISGSNSVCSVNDLYLITGNTSSALALATGLSGSNRVQFSNGDVLGINQTGAGGPLSKITTPASMQKVRMVTYFVTTDGILMRKEYANITPDPPGTLPTKWVEEPLVYGVEDFQIQYVLNDGTVSANPSAALSAIRQVRYTISVRGTQDGPGGQPFRETMTSTFSTTNLGYSAS